MKLYYSPGACSLAPHVMLREIGQPFELAEVNTGRGEHRQEPFLTINPRARVPAIEVEGEYFTESPAILTFLALRYPELRFLPSLGSSDLLRCLEWLAWFSSSVHVAFLQLWRPERHIPNGAESVGLAEHARATIERLTTEVEERLVGPWLLGEQYTIADIYALVFFGWGNRIGLEMGSRYPRWGQWSERMLQRDAVREALGVEGLDGWFPVRSS